MTWSPLQVGQRGIGDLQGILILLAGGRRHKAGGFPLTTPAPFTRLPASVLERRVPDIHLPLMGVRVLDLTRVLAGYGPVEIAHLRARGVIF